jgi:predicted PurR-regulated permease PerM
MLFKRILQNIPRPVHVSKEQKQQHSRSKHILRSMETLTVGSSYFPGRFFIISFLLPFLLFFFLRPPTGLWTRRALTAGGQEMSARRQSS